jgi:impB/mucB/samB family
MRLGGESWLRVRIESDHAPTTRREAAAQAGAVGDRQLTKLGPSFESIRNVTATEFASCEHMFVAEEATTLHADVDSFFASVEQRDDAHLRGLPVIVGGWVVLAASYEAKAHGVRTAMSVARARRLCPAAVVVEPRMSAYAEASKAVYRVFDDAASLVEGLSIDDAFLDVRGVRRLSGTPSEVAVRLKSEVRERAAPRDRTPRPPLCIASSVGRSWNDVRRVLHAADNVRAAVSSRPVLIVEPLLMPHVTGQDRNRQDRLAHDPDRGVVGRTSSPWCR